MNWKLLLWVLIPTPILKVLTRLDMLRWRVYWYFRPPSSADFVDDLHRLARLLHEHHALTPEAAQDITALIEEFEQEETS